MYLLRLTLAQLNKEEAERFEKSIAGISGVQKIDVWPAKAEVTLVNADIITTVVSTLREAGFVISTSPDRTDSSSTSTVDNTPKVIKVQIAGMTCRSCEITIERKFKKIPGIRKVEVDAGRGLARIICEADYKPDLQILRQAVQGEKYIVQDFYHPNHRSKNIASSGDSQPRLLQLVGIFSLVLGLGWLFSKIGIFDKATALGGTTTFVSAVLLGLVAGTSSCLAVAGGLLLSSAAKFNERYSQGTASERMRPVLLFVAGRVLSYGLLGGLIGLIGKALTPSPFFTGVLMIIAAVYMVIMGLEMLKICPVWLKRLLPRMPKTLSHSILDAEGHAHPIAPFLLGAATFFLPCGFTQALQIFALTTGSFVGSGAILAGFALGTVPALLILGWASTSLKGKFGQFFFRFSGALVIILGLTNVQNGFAAAGYSFNWPDFSGGVATGVANAADPNVQFDGKTQIIKMKIGVDPFYSPSDRYTIRSGIPVRMEISGVGTGCRSIFQIPQLAVSTFLDKALNLVEFTPTRPGNLTFSCSMGMYRGSLVVVP